MGFFEKNLRVLPPVVVAGRHVKRYEVTTPGLVVEPELWAAALEFLPKLYPGFDDPTPPASVMVLHRGEAGLYLNAYNWVWDNVLHCRTASSGNQPFLGSHSDDLTEFTEITKQLIGCVWELPPLHHERDAWVRHMLRPAVPDLAGYLTDVLPDGLVGGA